MRPVSASLALGEVVLAPGPKLQGVTAAAAWVWAFPASGTVSNKLQSVAFRPSSPNGLTKGLGVIRS